MTIVRLISPEVSCTVNEPSKVERKHVAGHRGDKESVPVRFTE